jgi:hypothetical protein
MLKPDIHVVTTRLLWVERKVHYVTCHLNPLFTDIKEQEAEKTCTMSFMICTPQNYSGAKMKENESGGECSTHRRYNKCNRVFVRQPAGMRLPGISSGGWYVGVYHSGC